MNFEWCFKSCRADALESPGNSYHTSNTTWALESRIIHNVGHLWRLIGITSEYPHYVLFKFGAYDMYEQPFSTALGCYESFVIEVFAFAAIWLWSKPIEREIWMFRRIMIDSLTIAAAILTQSGNLQVWMVHGLQPTRYNYQAA